MIKRYIGIFLLLLVALAVAAHATENQPSPPPALILIDIQDFYFPGGKVPLTGPEEAAANAGRLLEFFRTRGWPVIHVRHEFQPGGDIHASVAPRPGETVITKKQVNAFHGTVLAERLDHLGVRRLVLAGMQTHMCLEAATRAAHDLGYECMVAHDACATRDLRFGDRTVSAADVHASTLATLHRTYARVSSSAELLAELTPPGNRED